MRDIKSNSFNGTLSSLFVELKNTVNNLSPQHIQLLPTNLVDVAREITENEFSYDDGAMVNSVDMYKLNGMIRHLTANNIEYYTGGRDIPFGETDVDKKVIKDTIYLPDGWDGRNGFAFFEDFNTMTAFARRSKGGSKTFSHITITNNKNHITVSGYYYNKERNVDERFYLTTLRLRYILWRNKDV